MRFSDLLDRANDGQKEKPHCGDKGKLQISFVNPISEEPPDQPLVSRHNRGNPSAAPYFITENECKYEEHFYKDEYSQIFQMF